MFIFSRESPCCLERNHECPDVHNFSPMVKVATLVGKKSQVQPSEVAPWRISFGKQLL